MSTRSATWGVRVCPSWMLRVLSLSLSLSLSLCVCVCVCVCVCGCGRWDTWDSPADSVSRSEPIEIRPVVSALIPMAVRDVEWIERLIQPPATGKLSSSYCLHLLRVHGLAEHLDHGEFPSGAALLELLLDAAKATGHFGQSTLIQTRYGVRFPAAARSVRDPSMEVHQDQTLATLAELGIPLPYPLSVGGRTQTVRDALSDSLANFSLDQEELSWTALAYALYLPPSKGWTNRYGEGYSFNELADALMASRLEKASCGGVHVAHALTILKRVDRDWRVLSDGTRMRIGAWLRTFRDAALRAQDPEGFWRLGTIGVDDAKRDGWTPPDSAANRILMTGHLTEWMLHLPRDLQVPSEVLVNAGMWLYRELRAASPEAMQRDVCPYSHAVCALRLLAYSLPDQIVTLTTMAAR